MSQILPRNGFYFFVEDWIKEKKKCGCHVPNFMDAYSDPDCIDTWKNLPTYKKRPFKSLSKTYKINRSHFENKNKLFNDSKATTDEITKEKLQCQEDIISTVHKASVNNTVQDLEFYFIHVNWFYFDQTISEYALAEFALGKFSLKNGITRIHHTIICTKPQKGYAREAMQRSRETHQIPLNCPVGQTDFSVMYKDLISFLQLKLDDKKFPPFYAEKPVFEIAKSLLRQLTAAANNDENLFTVYPLELLFTTLNASPKLKYWEESDDINNIIGNAYFPNDKFYHVTNIECEFHKNKDCTNIYCSQAIVKRWGYIICDHYCRYYNINMRPGFHCPPNSYESENYLPNKLNSLTLQNAEEVPATLSTAKINEDNLEISGHTDDDKHLQPSTNKTNTSPWTSVNKNLHLDTKDDLSSPFDYNFPPLGMKFKSTKKKGKLQ